jgi:hypothetical protein
MRARSPLPSSEAGLRARIRYIASVGTSVREKKYDAHIANTTASASGTNR